MADTTDSTSKPEFIAEELGFEIEKRAIMTAARQCLASDEMIAEFNRLHGCHIGQSKKMTRT